MKKIQASLTVEAAFVLPIFLFFFQALLYLFQMFYIQEQLQYAISETGKNIAKQVSLVDRIKLLPEDEEQNDLSEDATLVQNIMNKGISVAYFRQMVEKYLDIKFLEDSSIINGFHGISFLGSSIKDDIIDIVINYQVQIPLPILKQNTYTYYQRVTLRAWTGIKINSKVSEVTEEEGKAESEMVYVTETGTVYHTSQSCTHIALEQKIIKGKDIATERNSSFGRYGPCERCAKAPLNMEKEYIITTNGDRYHTTSSCSGLKRTVKKVKLEEVSHLRQCARCKKKMN